MLAAGRSTRNCFTSSHRTKREWPRTWERKPDRPKVMVSPHHIARMAMPSWRATTSRGTRPNADKNGSSRNPSRKTSRPMMPHKNPWLPATMQRPTAEMAIPAKVRHRAFRITVTGGPPSSGMQHHGPAGQRQAGARIGTDVGEGERGDHKAPGSGRRRIAPTPVIQNLDHIPRRFLRRYGDGSINAGHQPWQTSGTQPRIRLEDIAGYASSSTLNQLETLNVFPAYQPSPSQTSNAEPFLGQNKLRGQAQPEERQNSSPTGPNNAADCQNIARRLRIALRLVVVAQYPDSAHQDADRSQRPEPRLPCRASEDQARLRLIQLTPAAASARTARLRRPDRAPGSGWLGRRI